MRDERYAAFNKIDMAQRKLRRIAVTGRNRRRPGLFSAGIVPFMARVSVQCGTGLAATGDVRAPDDHEAERLP